MVTLLAALFFSASFEPIGLWFLAPIGFALLFKTIERTNSPVISLFSFGLISQGVILFWSGKYVGLLPWALLSILQAIYLIPVGFIFKKTRNLWYTIGALLLMDEIRSRFPFGGFGWTRIGFSQADAPYLNMVAIGGVALLSFLVLLLAYLISHLRARSVLLICLICFLPVGTSGPLAASNSLTVAGVQGNTPKVGLKFNERAEAVFNLHLEKTRTIAKPVDLIVWPENASDIDPFLTPGIKSKLAILSQKKDSPIIIGAVLRSNGTLRNASILLDSMSTKSIYIKQHLTPFGEYIPLRGLAEFISPYAAGVRDFSPGGKYLVHKVGDFEVGPIICYEIIDDSLVRLAAAKSDALVVQTNSATFSGTSESAQQLNITRIRAAEHNRDILSVSTVGISALIDNNGKVLKQSRENVSEIIYGSLRSNRHETISDKLGERSWILIAGLSTLYGALRRRRFV